MWATLTLLAAASLPSGQTGQIRFSNERATFGVMGPTRSEAKILPGDFYFLSFDIENLKVDKNGKVLYNMVMELLDSKGDSKYKGDQDELELTNSLGGNRLPAFAHAVTNTDTPPGVYTMKVTVTDRSTKKSETLTRKFEVAAPDFGLVRINNTYDDRGAIPAASVTVTGQSIWVHSFAAGFKRDDKTKQPDLTLEVRILDEDKRPTLDKPTLVQIPKDIPKDWTQVPFLPTAITLNRKGKFTVELKATDQVSKKTTKTSFPITVVEPQ